MSELVYAIVIGLPIWWLAQTLLCLRDYFRKRREERAKPPLTDEERAEIAKFEAELPRKEVKPVFWYFTHPKEGLRLIAAALLHLPLAIIFLPMVILIFVLPNPNRR